MKEIDPPRWHVRVVEVGNLVVIQHRTASGQIHEIPFEPKHARALASELNTSVDRLVSATQLNQGEAK